MKIVHISTRDNLGGAARAAFRIHSGLNAEGHISRMVVGWKSEATTDVEGVVPDGSIIQKIKWRLVLGADRALSLQNLWIPWSGKYTSHPVVKSADVIHLHNIHGGGASHRIIPKLGKIAPLVWTLHDTWALTGHCGFSCDCERWRTGCGKCPNLKDDPAISIDTTALLWRVKKWVYNRSNLVIVTPSEWLANLARQSPLLQRFPIQAITYGLDTDTFRPVEKSAARLTVGVPEDAKVVLFVGYSLSDDRKGGRFLIQAMRRLADSGERNIWVLTVGQGNLFTGDSAIPYPVRSLGTVSSDHLLATCYSAADVFVGPSTAESFGQVFSESMASGTPCVAFNNTAIPEVVRHMETGYVAKDRNSEDLAYGIKLLLGDDELRRKMATMSREIAVKEFPLRRQAQRYSELYSQLIEERARGRNAGTGDPAFNPGSR